MQNNYILQDSIAISKTNVPTRAGQRINSLSELEKVPTPFIGMIIYVEDQDLFIYVKTLKSSKIGNFEIKNSLIDEYDVLSGKSGDLIWNEVL